MSVATRAIELVAHLPPARTRAIAVRRDLEVPMADGITLRADRYRARDHGMQPVILMRSPYGRGGLHEFAARIFAERGFQVVVQSCRGTFGSGGTFDAYRDEAQDGQTTLAWIEAQPWCPGRIAMFGPSYLGIAQWAAATDPPASLRALAPAITSSRVRAFTYTGGAFSLDSTLAWLEILAGQRRTAQQGVRARIDVKRRMAKAFATLPLRDADSVLTGEHVPFYQDWLAHEHDDAFWQPVEFDRHLDAVSIPVTMVTGWYDMFLPVQLADYLALRAAGHDARLTIGPWKHTDPGVAFENLRESLDWFGLHLLDAPAVPRARVRLYIGGSKRWVEFDEWPPPARTVRWHLQPGGGLHPRMPEGHTADRFRYDPSDPTPSVGGSLLASSGGPQDNRALEQRGDVLVYTSSALARDVEVIGPVSAELHVRSSLEHTDFFVRVCDVEPSGKSINICDGLARLGPDDWHPGTVGVAAVSVSLWPAAHVFRRGHRIRMQVSSGAHPRFARNLGGGEPLGTASVMHIADQEVWHGADHPSAVVLPVRDPI